eukprot:TRINITY_DN11426_c1_g1_i3.p1 TRINITY_DN11426_c1_g1~~TRINITY_DN11426_c1_g1_i3.p1  ORF type:complete len:318 (-),score=47.39 TRINITY_DN11426_c1_g1_i3:83-973(-)
MDGPDYDQDFEDEWEAHHREDLEIMRELEEMQEAIPTTKRKLDFANQNKNEVPSTGGSADADDMKRQRTKTAPSLKSSSSSSSSSKPPTIAPRTFYTLLPPTAPSLTFTSSRSGKRMYVTIKSEDEHQAEIATAIKSYSRGQSSLLTTPISYVLDKIDKQKLKEALAEAEAGPRRVIRPGDGKLWVDRYAPTAFTDLLSDERTNRSVLSWLKEWDPIVYPARYAATIASNSSKSPPKYQKYKPYTSKQDAKGEDQGKQEYKKKDPLAGPTAKILLLCGPPGLGKTTLAHVLARQAG